MKIAGFTISRDKAQAYAQPPMETKEGKFIIYEQADIIIPATIQNFKTALQGARVRTIQHRNMLYDMYSNSVDFDAALSGAMRKRIKATAGRRLEYIVNGEKYEGADALINTPAFNKFIEQLIESLVFWGMGVFQFGTKKWNDQILFDFNRLPIKHIDPYMQLIRYRSDSASQQDQSYKNVKQALFVGDKDNLGLLLQLTLLSLYKREVMNQWSNYIRLAGNNFERVSYKGEIPDPKRRREILNKISNRTSSALDFDDVDVKFDNLSSISQNDLFEGSVAYFDEQIVTMILGQTMTTADGSSKSQAEVHERTQEVLFDADANDVLNVLNYDFVEVQAMYNIPAGGVWQYVENANTRLHEQADLDAKLVGLGYVFGMEEIKQRYGL